MSAALNIPFVRSLPPVTRASARPYGHWQAVLATLSKRPGRWGKIGTALDYRNVYSVITRHPGQYALAIREGVLFGQRRKRALSKKGKAKTRRAQ